MTDDLTMKLISGKGSEVKNQGRTSTLNWEGGIIEDVQSGSGDDQITGNSLGNFINAGTGGADSISSFGRDDFITCPTVPATMLWTAARTSWARTTTRSFTTSAIR